jgi:hypothetical protein
MKAIRLSTRCSASGTSSSRPIGSRVFRPSFSRVAAATASGRCGRAATSRSSTAHGRSTRTGPTSRSPRGASGLRTSRHGISTRGLLSPVVHRRRRRSTARIRQADRRGRSSRSARSFRTASSLHRSLPRAPRSSSSRPRTTLVGPRRWTAGRRGRRWWRQASSGSTCRGGSTSSCSGTGPTAGTRCCSQSGCSRFWR